MKCVIAPSILAADFGQLYAEVQAVVDAGCDFIHIDVMDGHFVPNITMGPLVVKSLRKRFACTLDVHLMVESPERLIDDFAEAGANIITVHKEATPHVHRALQMVRSHGIQAGLAVNPGTSLEGLEYVYDLLDQLLIMTVNPGFGGQRFIDATLKKIRSARSYFEQIGRKELAIEVDGGINQQTIALAKEAGANIFVAGSAIFGEDDRALAVSNLQAEIR